MQETQLDFRLNAAEVGFLFGEVDEQAGQEPGRFQIRPNLGVMGSAQLFNRLQFQDHRAGDDEIEPVSSDQNSLVEDFDFFLSFDGDVDL